MHIQVNTDNHLTGGEKLIASVETLVANALSHLSDQISRVEVHLSDENGSKAGGDDVRCMMEARLEGRQPTAVTHHASTVTEALDGAAEKLRRVIEGTLDRLRARK